MQPLIQYYYDYFTDPKNDGYLLLCSSVALGRLNGLYDRFVMDSIKPIEMIEEEEKKKYWQQALRFYPDTETRITAMKAAYTLVSLTGKND